MKVLKRLKKSFNSPNKKYERKIRDTRSILHLQDRIQIIMLDGPYKDTIICIRGIHVLKSEKNKQSLDIQWETDDKPTSKEHHDYLEAVMHDTIYEGLETGQIKLREK